MKSLPQSISSFSSSLSSIDETSTLIPGLPNDVAALLLSFVPYSHHARVKSTCKSWRLFFSSKILISLRFTHPNSLSHLLCFFPQDPLIASPFLFDPLNLSWCPLPPMPCNPHVYGLCNFTSISVGPHLYVIGGSLFDTRSYPIDRPSSSSSAFRFDFYASLWEPISPMLSPRGSFACAAVPDSGQILVAGGGSRHTMFAAAGSRMSSVERYGEITTKLCLSRRVTVNSIVYQFFNRYDVERDEWVALDGLPRFRAGCVGFFVGSGDKREFWVMGGYGESRTISGVFPVDEYYRDAVVMELRKGTGGGRWRQIGDMWEEGERRKLGKIVVIENQNRGQPGIFMLDGDEFFRYEMASNRWVEESRVPTKIPFNSSYGFVALNGELYVISFLKTESVVAQRLRRHKKGGSLYMQIYNPEKKTWRSLVTRSPFHYPMDFDTAAICTVRM